MENSNCNHNVVFYGMTNLNESGKIVGVIDIWKCSTCEDLFTDYKRIGELTLQPKLGFDEAGEGAKWGVFVCSKEVGVEWKLMGIKPGQKISHECVSDEMDEFTVREDFSLEDNSIENKGVEHRIILIEDYLNKPVEIGYDKLSSHKL